MQIAVLDDYQRRAKELADWDSLAPDAHVSFFHASIDPALLADQLARFDVLVLMRERTPFPRAVLERLPRLALLVTTGMNNASIDLAYLRERGVVVSGTPFELSDPSSDGLPIPVEVAWALILALVKRTRIEDHAVREGHWQLGMPGALAGATLGLAGLGFLGAAMVAPAKLFGMSLIAWSENLSDDRAAELDVQPVSKEELLARSDVLSIHLRMSDRTNRLFAERELAQMKPTAFLINTSRGPIVDEPALIKALASGTIAAAGLDVFDQEPLPREHPLMTLENTVLLPHFGYVSEYAVRAMYTAAVEAIVAFLNHAPIRVLT